MVNTVQITQTQFLAMYARRAVEEIVNLKIGTEQRVYGRTAEGQSNNPDGYIVVYAIIT